MRITDLPTTTDVAGYVPIDIDGATYKTPVDVITPNVANNLSTTSAGYVLDARQGKVLNDAVSGNTSGIASSQGTVTTGLVVDADQWTLYQSRTLNGTTLYYPRTAKEVLISLTVGDLMINSIFLPGVITENIYFQIGGYYSKTSPSSTAYLSAYYYVPIYYETRGIGSLFGVSDSATYVLKVYYR